MIKTADGTCIERNIYDEFYNVYNVEFKKLSFSVQMRNINVFVKLISVLLIVFHMFEIYLIDVVWKTKSNRVFPIIYRSNNARN